MAKADDELSARLQAIEERQGKLHGACVQLAQAMQKIKKLNSPFTEEIHRMAKNVEALLTNA